MILHESIYISKIIVLSNLEKEKIIATSHMVDLFDPTIAIPMTKVEHGPTINIREKEKAMATE